MIESEKDFELLERRLRERIESDVKGSLFKAYGIAGTAVAAVLGFTGYNLISEVEKHANASVDEKIVSSTKALDQYVERRRDQLDSLLGQLQTGMDKSSVMSDIVHGNLAKLQTQAESVAPMMAAMNESSITARQNIVKLSADSEALAKSLENARQQTRNVVSENERMAILPDQLDALNKRVEDLAEAVARLAESDQQSTEKTAVADTANRVAASSVTTRSTIATQQARTVLFFQYSEIQEDAVQAIAERLRHDGILVPNIDSEPMNGSRFRVVRFYNPEDEEEARRVAALTTRAIVEVGLPPGDVRVEDYTFWKGVKLKPNNIELWLGEPKRI